MHSISLYIYTHLYTHIYTYIHMYMYMYIYIYMHVCIDIIYACIDIQRLPEMGVALKSSILIGCFIMNQPFWGSSPNCTKSLGPQQAHIAA